MWMPKGNLIELNQITVTLKDKTMNTRYNIFEAIDLRGKTIREAGLADPEVCPAHYWDEVITFSMSIQMTKGSWPEPPLVYEVVGAGPKIRTLKKGDWKTMYASYRRYIKGIEVYQKPKCQK